MTSQKNLSVDLCRARLEAVARIDNWNNFKLLADGTVQKKHYTGCCYRGLKWVTFGVVPLLVNITAYLKHKQSDAQAGIQSLTDMIRILKDTNENPSQLKLLADRTATSLTVLSHHVNAKRGIIGTAISTTFDAIVSVSTAESTTEPGATPTEKSQDDDEQSSPLESSPSSDDDIGRERETGS